MEFSLEGLGMVIREARLAEGLNQEDLGALAGYGAGAGVSVSRIENGLTRPGKERFAGLAENLDMTPSQLEAEAAKRTAKLAAGTTEPRRAPSEERLKERLRRVQRELERRTSAVTTLGEAFNEAHDRARDGFFMPFVELASGIDGAPQPNPSDLPAEDPAADVETKAALRIKVTSHNTAILLAGGAGGAAAGAAVGGAAAYTTFMATAVFGTASTGAAISGLSGAAASSATLALLGGGSLAAGGAGVAGGTMLLTGIVAAPALILALGGLAWMVRRNRNQQKELAAQLDEVEHALSATLRGFEALVDILPRATRCLEYIAVHASHALQRWERELGARLLDWASFDDDERRRYQDFVQVAASQLAVVTIDLQDLLAKRGDDRERLIEFADEVLTQSEATIEQLV